MFLRTILAAVAAVFITTIAAGAGGLLDNVTVLQTRTLEPSGTVELGETTSSLTSRPSEHMRLDPNVVSLEQQFDDRLACRPIERMKEGSYFLLKGLTELHQAVNHSTPVDVASLQKQQLLIEEHGWPEVCTLLAKAVHDDGQEVIALVAITPWGDQVMLPNDDNLYARHELYEFTGYRVVERQHPRHRNVFVAVVN